MLLTAISISGWLSLSEEKENSLNETRQRGQDISRYVAKSLSFSVIGYDYQMIQLLLNDIVNTDEIKYVEVLNKKQKSMAKAGNLDESKSGDLLVFIEKIMLDQNHIGTLILVLSTKKYVKRLETQKFSLVAREAMIIILIAIGEFIALSFIIINPVNVIIKAIDGAVNEKGEVVADIPLSTNDEFGHLATKFNELGAQLNFANQQLQKKIEMADEKLITNNRQLLQQADELKRMNNEFRQMSITDALTGLYNRRHFEEVIRVELSMSNRHGDQNGILLIDIDHFKSVNDTYGHIAGDNVLKAVANAMNENLRKTDVLCRVGGEEFVVFCKRVDKENLQLVAMKLRNRIENMQIPLNGQMVKVTISVGGATFESVHSNMNVDEIYRQADRALYYCKAHGRNQYIHYLDMESG